MTGIEPSLSDTTDSNWLHGQAEGSPAHVVAAALDGDEARDAVGVEARRADVGVGLLVNVKFVHELVS